MMDRDGEREDRLREMGLAPLWRRRMQRAAQSAADESAAEESAPQAAAPTIALPQDPPAVPVDVLRAAEIAARSWDELPAHIAGCTACGLCRSRTKTVPGSGTAPAEWMFVGEAPGADEDAQGEPFVGQAGRLLDNMLHAIGLRREQGVFITNVLKCRPPNNRNPEPMEVSQCAHYLARQVELVRPRVIVALGRFAALTLLHKEATISSLRGHVHRYRDTPLIVTYHPAYLLRSLPEKAKAWEDLVLAKRTHAGLHSVEGPQT